MTLCVLVCVSVYNWQAFDLV